ncbi:hypothetical protein BC937DRAFT_93070 [Endogone sp. FLAS-F59071]|nr:hypothetical protein BC937DRAFT_93070 [Endogone sp. FLAS-F59071]|eukprot:RUS14979.1 hypothetical protein BC937DRAFT_93070 [Endogone sp. FLAS-F59071]
MLAKLLVLAALALQVTAQLPTNLDGIQSSASYAAQKSPVFPSGLVAKTPVAAVPTPGATIPTASLSQSATLTGYPPTWTIPPTDSPEVVAAIAAIDWSLVPNSPVKTFDASSNPIVTNYSASDPDCWWSDTNCVVPKVSYLPPDIWYCPRDGG